MTFDDLAIWRVTCQFVGADSKSGISFALSNDPEAQASCKVRIITAEISYGLRKRTMALVTLRDLDPRATVYGS